MVRILLLAAGFGTRLQKDLESEGGRLYSHLRGLPKPLVQVGHSPLASHWVRALEEAGEDPAASLWVVTNALYLPMFRRWAANHGIPAAQIINDGARSNETRLGAVADIHLALQRMGGPDEEGLLVIGGDTLFLQDFSLRDVLRDFRSGDESLVLWYPVEETEKHGVLELDDATGRVTAFLEKPARHETESRRACPCFYAYRPEACALMAPFLEAVSGGELRLRDAPGNFLAWAHSRTPVRARRVDGRHDIGGLKSYIAAHRAMLGQSEGREAELLAAAAAAPGGAVVESGGEDDGDGDDVPAACPPFSGAAASPPPHEDNPKPDGHWEDLVPVAVAGAAAVAALAMGVARLFRK